MKTYKIVRFYRDGVRTTILTGLLLSQAQAYCNDPRTAAEDWFDGYEEE